ncbi:unnamed protein product [Ilex paraguariensis]|uniref:Protein JASON n=1 Tax=Ilex paraguariensis TaxID=185542 RepID=A0ABC8QKQ5_9AQUA
MICSWFERDFLGFFRRSAKAMGCFFGCFRIKDDGVHHPQTHLISEPLPRNATELVVDRNRNRNRLSSLLLSEEKDASPSKDKENVDLGTPDPDFDVRELQNEAKFLKACGTLPETPAEIRVVSEKLKDSSLNDGATDSSKFHTWLPSNTIQTLNLEKQLDQPPTPIKLCEGVKGLGSSLQTPISCTAIDQNTERLSASTTEGSGVGDVDMTIKVHSDHSYESASTSVRTRRFAASSQCRNKSVRFDCKSDASSLSSESSSSEIASHISKQTDSTGNYSVSKSYPYPTPLKLTDEMQTPGTVFPSYLQNMGNGKNLRIRSQYVYSVMNPVEDLSQWEVLKEEDFSSNQMTSKLRESLEKADDVSSNSEGRMSETSVEKELKVEASLSSWLKPQPTNLEGNNRHFGAIFSDNACRRRTLGDRPILGMVAAHWNEDEPSRISPKWWDGNGIPNSTTKYKEDQKVSWHATPFEERLEKALSEETFISRKDISGTPPPDFDGHEECDTASSQLQSSTHLKSLVSF